MVPLVSQRHLKAILGVFSSRSSQFFGYALFLALASGSRFYRQFCTIVVNSAPLSLHPSLPTLPNTNVSKWYPKASHPNQTPMRSNNPLLRPEPSASPRHAYMCLLPPSPLRPHVRSPSRIDPVATGSPLVDRGQKFVQTEAEPRTNRRSYALRTTPSTPNSPQMTSTRRTPPQGTSPDQLSSAGTPYL
jgi:hypothetical protein